MSDRDPLDPDGASTDDDWPNTATADDKLSNGDDDTDGDSGEDVDGSDAFAQRIDEFGRTVGSGLARGVLIPSHAIKVAIVTFLSSILRKIPFVGRSFWRSHLKWATRQYQQAAGADVVNFSAEPHGLEPRACNWVESDPDHPDEKPGWREVGGDRTWGPGSEGRDVERFGKADVILTDRAAHETATPLKLRFAEALDLEQVQGLVTDPTITKTVVQQWPADPEEVQGGGQAVADGGAQMLQRREERPVVDPADVGLDDAVVDLASDFGDGKGMRVSARKYKHAKLSKTDAEEMQNQETRGYLAGKAGRDEGELIRLFIIVLVVIAIVAVGPTFVSVLFGGGGGGGGGGMLPIMLGLLG